MSNSRRLEQRVVRAAESALADKQFVAPIDVLVGLGWLAPAAVDRWRQGRVDCLEAVCDVSLHKISAAMSVLRRWAQSNGLVPSETTYVARSRQRQTLRFSRSGDTTIEQAYRTHWVSPQLSERKRERLAERQSRPPDLVVVSPVKAFTCSLCATARDDLLLMEDSGPVCLQCADLDHLVFVPSGDAALTRRAKAGSRLSAIVVRFSGSRGRYERKGILVEETALELAEAKCLADEDVRARRRDRDAQRRRDEDVDLVERMTEAMLGMFPGCPAQRVRAIARHCAARGSGRVGRSAAGRALEPESIELAVVASLRHEDTTYDELLMSGMDRPDARARVRNEVTRILDGWRAGTTPPSRETG